MIVHLRMPIHRTHLYRKHRDIPATSSDDQVGVVASYSMGLFSPDVADGGCEDVSFESRLQLMMAKFVLKARAERSLTQTTLNGIMEDITGMGFVILPLLYSIYLCILSVHFIGIINVVAK